MLKNAFSFIFYLSRSAISTLFLMLRSSDIFPLIFALIFKHHKVINMSFHGNQMEILIVMFLLKTFF